MASYHTRYENYLTYYGLGALLGPVSAYLKWFYGSCRELYAPSESMAEILKAEGISTEIRLWSRGVDTENFHPNKRSSAWRAKHGIAEDELVICFVSRLVREKELDTLVDVLEGLRRRNVPHRSVIVGDGPDRNFLEQKLPGSIFTGFLVGDELARAYASSDIFLFPQRNRDVWQRDARGDGVRSGNGVCRCQRQSFACGSGGHRIFGKAQALPGVRRVHSAVGGRRAPARADAGCGSRAQP